MTTKNNVLLGATWCGPCKRVKEFLESKGVSYTYVDVDTEEGLGLAKNWRVRSVPSMSIDGKIVSGDKEIMGMFSEQE